jgi:CHAT domain-containing protein
MRWVHTAWRAGRALGGSTVKYLRFQLLFTLDRSGGYTVQVLAPNMQGEVYFEPPWPGVDASAFASAFQAGSQDSRQLTPHSMAPSQSPESLGKLLFARLFQGEIRLLYERSLDAAAHAKTGLRIELTFNPLHSNLSTIQALPWELLRPPGESKFLALNPATPVTRFLKVPRPIYAAARPQTLRILAVAASPRGLPSLALAKELRNLQEAVGLAAKVIPVAPTLVALRQALSDSEYHVLHFMGHGGSLPGQKEYVLLFEAKDGGPDPVTGTDLANTLAASPTLRLVVLNACESARVRKVEADGRGFDPFSGVANALVLGDLPAVIAMQHLIFDDVAITFSRTFYEKLAAGLPVDAAVTEGRRAVHSEHRGLAWATPILFMRTPTGELYPEEDLWDRPPEKKRARWLVAALLSVLLAGGIGLMLHNWRAWQAERLVTEGTAPLVSG